MILLIFGIFLIDFFFWFLIGVIFIMALAYIYPFLEETNIVRSINQEKIIVSTTITESGKLPINLELRIKHYQPLVDWVESEEMKDALRKYIIEKTNEEMSAEIAAGAEVLLQFVGNPIKVKAKEYLHSIKNHIMLEYVNVYMLIVEENSDLPDIKFR